MTKRIGVTPALLILTLSLFGLQSVAFGQDITLHQATTSSGMMGGGARNATATQYYSSKAMRTTSSAGQDSIIRFDTGKIINIDNKQKTYTEITFEQLNEMLPKLGEQAGADKEKMEQMRKMMAQMGQQMSESFSVTKEGPGETIAGYATDKYHVTGPMEMEIHASPDLKIPAVYYDVMKMGVQRNPMFDMSKLYDEMKKITGMPLKTVMTMKMMNMEMKTTTVVTSVEKGPIPASMFEVPAGYKQVPMKF
ncbi:MAG TPA: DUF4412 domain-containing protein [Acidobacteriota bacterium]|nr:DUF4412 domain-containing protein [Acidobacteriota bacterium]